MQNICILREKPRRTTHMLKYQALIFVDKNFALPTQPPKSLHVGDCLLFLTLNMNFYLPMEIFKYNFCLIPGLILWFKVLKGEQSLNSYQNEVLSKILVWSIFYFPDRFGNSMLTLPKSSQQYQVASAFYPRAGWHTWISRANAFFFFLINFIWLP